MPNEPKARVRFVVLAALVVQACLIRECDDDCDPATEDCSLSTTCCTPPGAPTATPRPPVALRCENDAIPGEAFFTVLLWIKDGQPPFRWTVDFGDTQAAQGTNQGIVFANGEARQSVDHRYAELPGLEPVVYTVRGTVTDARNQSQSCSVTQMVDPRRLDLDCEVAPRAGVVPLTVTFDSRPTGCVGTCEVAWDFGDGESATGRHAVHTYTAPGTGVQRTHPARGTLTDAEGRSTYCPRAVQVLPESAPTPTPSPSPSASPTPTATSTPVSNGAPVISNFRVEPAKMAAGGPAAQVTATITDPDGNPVTWSLTVAGGSQATGTFLPAAGSGGTVTAQFAPAVAPTGTATLRLTAVDSLGASAQATFAIFVYAP